MTVEEMIEKYGIEDDHPVDFSYLSDEEFEIELQKAYRELGMEPQS